MLLKILQIYDFYIFSQIFFHCCSSYCCDRCYVYNITASIPLNAIQFVCTPTSFATMQIIKQELLSLLSTPSSLSTELISTPSPTINLPTTLINHPLTIITRSKQSIAMTNKELLNDIYYLSTANLATFVEFQIGSTAGNQLIVKSKVTTPTEFVICGVFEIDSRSLVTRPFM